jgi:PAS domain S-box-containing protein
MIKKTQDRALLEKIRVLEKKSQELDRLRQESEKFRRYAEATCQGMGMADFEGNITYVNPRLATMRDPQNKIRRIGKSFFDSYPPELQKKLKTEILPQVRSQGSWVGELALLANDGQEIPTIENFFVVPDENGEPQYFGDIITDISEQKETQRLLAESEERYRVITEQTGQVLYDCHVATGQIYWAGTIRALTGYSKAEFKNFDMNNFPGHIHPQDLDRYLKLLNQARENSGRFNLEYRFKRKDGSYIHLEDQGVFLADAKGRATKMLGAIKDITLRKEHEAALEQTNQLLESKVRQRTARLAKANQELTREIKRRLKVEEDLRESENRYRIVSNNAGDGIAVIQDSRLVFANRALADLFEKPAVESVIGCFVGEVLCQTLHQDYQDFLLDLKASDNKSKTIRSQINTKDGKEIWLEGIHTIIHWEGRPAVLSTLRDITSTVNREIRAKQEAKKLRLQNIKLTSTIKDRYKFGDLIGKSQVMQELYEQILSACSTDASVVIYGESGTGKELVAKAIHDFSSRAKKPFVPVNCGAIPEYLMESEFFGHVKGAFTGADRDKKGFLDHADQGTLFLDEVGEISQAVQVKLLRALDGGGHTPLGTTRVLKSHFRIIAATNRALAEQVKKGRIREDFYYRTHIVPIYLPPLRERKEDIPLLADHFIGLFNKNKPKGIMSGKVMDALLSYHWPGNVRELQNVLQRYLTVGRLEFSSEWGMKKNPAPDQPEVPLNGESSGFKTKVEEFEKELIEQALIQTKYNRSKAAKLLELPRRTLFNKMQKFGL